METIVKSLVHYMLKRDSERSVRFGLTDKT